MTNDEDKMSIKNGHLKKMHFLGLEKRPKKTVQSEVKPNLKKKKNDRWDVCNQSCINSFDT